MRYVRNVVCGAVAVLGTALAFAAAGAGPHLAFAQEPAKGSAAFERFRYSFFEDPDSWRDGLDKASLAQLEGEERTRAETMLIARLPDDRAIIGLGVLRSERAAPRLVQLFVAERKQQFEDPRRPRSDSRRGSDRDWLPYRLIHLAKALWQIRPDAGWPAAAIDVLAFADNAIQRQTAAEELYDVRDPATVQALIKALDDPYGLVRHHAARALLAIHGLAADSRDPQHMTYRVMSDDAARHEGAKRDILAAIAGRPIAPP